jgi:hypothetical protein
LFEGAGSCVLVPALVVMLKLPEAGARKVLVQVMTEPLTKGLAGAVHDWVAPTGRPFKTQPGAAASLGPLFVQVPLTVTLCPAFKGGSATVLPTMSAWGVTMTGSVSTLFTELGSKVMLLALPLTLTVPVIGAVNCTLHTMLDPTARVVAGVDGTQFTVAPTGKPETTQLAVAAMLGPLLIHVTVPLTVLPAGALVGRPATDAAMSAAGVIPRGLVSTLFSGTSSCVSEPAVVLMFKLPDAGTVKVLVHVITALAANTAGKGSGVQLWVAPGGKPESAQVGVVAPLTPLLVQVPLTVITSPALGVTAGKVVAACMSALGTTPKEVCTVLLRVFGSAVSLPALAVSVTSVVTLTIGAVKLTVQTMFAPTARVGEPGSGTHTAVAPLGSESTAQVGFAATLGPLLVQVKVPVTKVPAFTGPAGKPLKTACMSACGTMAMGLVLTLLPLCGSAVALPAVVVMLKGPAPGAVKVLVQVMLEVMSKGLGKTAGMQVWVAPLGRPLRAQVGVAALLGPALVQVPLTVTLCPALTLAGTVVTACMSAWGTTPMDCWDWLLALKGSAVRLAAVPVTVTPPEGGIVKLMVQARVALRGSGLAPAGQVTVAPAGMPAGVQVAFTAGLGPLFLQVRVPLTVEPAGALAGKPATTACISACGTMGKDCVLTLLSRSGMGSAVVEPAVVVMLKGPVAGAMKVLVQVMALPRGKLGMALGVHDWVAPAGRPLKEQVGAAAALGPALVQVPLTVTL